MQCPSCRAEAADGDQFCVECGAPLPRACAACGHVMPATAKFCPQCGAKADQAGALTSLPSGPTPPSAPLAPVAPAERRQLTVMFCDLVGSTPLSTRYDPEDLREIVGAYHRRVADTVAHFGGFVAKYMGDGVLIYFGYPEAHEDDAERAARAGLAASTRSAGSRHRSR